MSTGQKLTRIATGLLLGSAFLCTSLPGFGGTTPPQAKRQTTKTRKKKQADPPPPLPSGPTGRPVQPLPLDAIAAVPPQVTFENNQLTIVAPNSTLADILRAIRKQTGAEIEIPQAPERVVTHLGPGPAREVVADLLNGSRFNYVLLGSPSDSTALTRIVLVGKSGAQEMTPNPVAQNTPPMPQGQFVQQSEPEPAEANEAEPAEDNANAGEENADQPPAEAEQNPAADQNGAQNGVRTPQQMLQEMQQRQMQLQQQQQAPGQQPPAGSGMPPHPPQDR